MKLGIVKRVDKADLTKKGEVPNWVDPLLDVFNNSIEQVGTALQNKLDFTYNFLGKEVSTVFTHNTELEVNPYPNAQASSLRVKGVIPMTTGETFIVGFKWTQKTNGNIGVTFKFDGATTATVKIQILLG